MMSEKRKIQRFNLDEGRIWEAIEGLSPYKTTYTLEEVCEKLNEQQADLNYLARFIGEFNVEEFKLKLRNLRILEDKVLEQQTTINKQERRIIVLENLLTNMGIKWVDDDELG